MSNGIEDIKQRLAGVVGKPWKYNPKHEMFMGTINALEMYEDTIYLGRDNKEYAPYEDATGRGCRLTPASVKRLARIKALGEFLECCREDIAHLLTRVRTAEARVAELESRLAGEQPLESEGEPV
jgi:hypothetical protein